MIPSIEYQRQARNKIYLYVEAVSVLLKFYGTESNIAKVTSNASRLGKAFRRTSVQQTSVLLSTAVRCRNTFLEKRTKIVFLSDYYQLLVSQKECCEFVSKMHIFWRFPSKQT